MNNEHLNFLEGRDFYYEGPFQVTKREFHLSRGYCCDSGCRHCPYQSIESGPKIISLSPVLTSILLAAGTNLIAGKIDHDQPDDLSHKFKRLIDFDISNLDDLSFDYVIFDNKSEYDQVNETIKSKSLYCNLNSQESLKNELFKLSDVLHISDLHIYAKRVDRIIQSKGSDFYNSSFDFFDLKTLRALEDQIFF